MGWWGRPRCTCVGRQSFCGLVDCWYSVLFGTGGRLLGVLARRSEDLPVSLRQGAVLVLCMGRSCPRGGSRSRVSQVQLRERVEVALKRDCRCACQWVAPLSAMCPSGDTSAIDPALIVWLWNAFLRAVACSERSLLGVLEVERS